jgi:hypothetical protein
MQKEQISNERTLLDGTKVEELIEPITLEIYTKCPSKWRLYDLETGQWYQGTNNPLKRKQWEKIKL